jgi:hypothetical protein
MHADKRGFSFFTAEDAEGAEIFYVSLRSPRTLRLDFTTEDVEGDGLRF